MKTSNFARAGNLPNAVAISVGVPRGWHGKRYSLLAPSYDMLKMSDKDYDDTYYSKIEKFDPKKVYKEIVERFGEDAILLCWESPNIRCHRRIVAEWFEQALGIEISEYGFERNAIKKYSEMLNKGEKPKKIEEKQPTLFDFM